ncbi:hypothetical protein ED312_04605 [Sinomicrobium pectinilyticum]|uniref:Uncharacterized protein n=1 Tax=Sinomicrobium pectinilyticum TaxID=1084421 RepID=A0A3N0EU61_SINP1|nr:hypothetical protein ED312_04605 [Sinomicrobium pectinilyticum]
MLVCNEYPLSLAFAMLLYLDNFYFKMLLLLRGVTNAVYDWALVANERQGRGICIGFMYVFLFFLCLKFLK